MAAEGSAPGCYLAAVCSKGGLDGNTVPPRTLGTKQQMGLWVSSNPFRIWEARGKDHSRGLWWFIVTTVTSEPQENTAKLCKSHDRHRLMSFQWPTTLSSEEHET